MFGLALVATLSAALTDLRATIAESRVANRGYVLASRESDLENFRLHVAEIDRDLTRLGSLVSDNPTQHARIAILRDAVLVLRGIQLGAQRAVRDGDFARATALITDGEGVEAVSLFATARAMTAAILVSLLVGLIAWSRMRTLLALQVTLRRAAEESAERVRQSEAFYRTLVANLPCTATLLFDGKGRVLIAAGEEVLRSVGMRPDRVVGEHLEQLACDESRAWMKSAVASAMQGKNARLTIEREGQHFEFRSIAVLDEGASVELGLLVIADVTERYLAELELRSLSLTDALTSLNNRRGFETLGEQLMTQARRERRQVVVVFADLDGLKALNDERGHEVGDRAIREAAHLFASCFRESDVVGRLGGDELAAITSGGDAAAFRERLTAALERYHAGPNVLPISLSIGTLVVSVDDERSLEQLLHEADALMYADKQARRATRRHLQVV